MLPQNYLKRISRVLFNSCFLLILLNISSQMYLVDHRPKHPNPERAQVYPLRVHYSVVYVSYSEHLVAGRPMFFLATACGLIGVALELRTKQREEG